MTQKKMWEAIEKLLDVADAIKVSLNKQGLQWNGKERVSVEPELAPSEATKENSELTEFEKAVNNLLWRNIERPSKFQSKPIEFTKNEASELLSIARKQVIDEGESWLRCQLISKYRNGILQCLRDDRAAFILDDFRKALEKGVGL